MATRDLGYSDYNVSLEQLRYILEYCVSEIANKDMILDCCDTVDTSLSSYIYQSLVFRKSYERLGYVPIGKNDFYGKKRKVIYELKKRLFGE